MAPMKAHGNASTAENTTKERFAEDAHRRKRVKLSDSSSEHSSASDHSALIPTSVPEESTDASDIDSDSSSELSESSEAPSSESSSDEDSDDSESEAEWQDGEADVVNLRANRGKKPVMKLGDEALDGDIRPFLKKFLPKLKAANEKLEAEEKAGTLKGKVIEEADGEEEGQYIEMDLGLGVLEAQRSDASDTSASEDDGDGGREDRPTQEKDILGKLMGREMTKATASIQEVEGSLQNGT